MANGDFEIRRFRSEDQIKARDLILAGLAERWGALDEELNTDLQDIAQYDQQGVFLIAYMNGALVGTGGFVQISADVVQIVRMSVAENARRLGIGRLIFGALCQHARNRGSKQVTLETTETWIDAIAFYERCGCQRSAVKDGNQYFIFDLNGDIPEGKY